MAKAKHIAIDNTVYDIEPSGSYVSGVKGNSETDYRTGNVNITKSNIGLGNVPNVTTNNQAPTFTQATSRANIASGETLTVIFGKIMKFFADLKTVAFSGSYTDLSDKPTIPTKVSELTNDSGYTTNTGTVTQVKVGSTAYNPSSGVVSLPAYPSDTNNRRVFYGTCATAAATAAKVITLSDATGWELKAGTTVVVRFTYTNTASSVTLNVNSSDAKSIYYNNAAYTGSSSTVCGYANRTYVYTYDGTYWVWVAHGVDDNTTYSSKAAASGGTAVSLVTTGEKYTWNNKGTGTVTQVNVGSTAYNPSSGVVSLPAYPTVNNATLTIQRNGTDVQTFTANSSSNKTANISCNTISNLLEASETGVAVNANSSASVTLAHTAGSVNDLLIQAIALTGAFQVHVVATSWDASNIYLTLGNCSATNVTNLQVKVLYRKRT